VVFQPWGFRPDWKELENGWSTSSSTIHDGVSPPSATVMRVWLLSVSKNRVLAQHSLSTAGLSQPAMICQYWLGDALLLVRWWPHAGWMRISCSLAAGYSSAWCLEKKQECIEKFLSTALYRLLGLNVYDVHLVSSLKIQIQSNRLLFSLELAMSGAGRCCHMMTMIIYTLHVLVFFLRLGFIGVLLVSADTAAWFMLPSCLCLPSSSAALRSFLWRTLLLWSSTTSIPRLLAKNYYNWSFAPLLLYYYAHFLLASSASCRRIII
jgi:hypothetical protein